MSFLLLLCVPLDRRPDQVGHHEPALRRRDLWPAGGCLPARLGRRIFGFKQVDRIEAWIPLFMFSILFGLSMDYHVFLLSRIKEQYDLTGNNAESVAYGLRTTA